jgi:hypothetical protein
LIRGFEGGVLVVALVYSQNEPVAGCLAAQGFLMFAGPD